jgi:hypothetical protein
MSTNSVSASKVSSFGHLKKLLLLVTAGILDGGLDCRIRFWKETIQGLSQPKTIIKYISE